MHTIEFPGERPPMLVRRPRPNHEESLRGFALRLDLENVTSLFRSRLGSIKEASFALVDIETATGRELDILRQRVFIQQTGEQTYSAINTFGHKVPKPWITTKFKRVCPSCLKDKGYMCALWEVHIIKSCRTHRCHLIHQCQSCKAPLEWERGGLLHCQCGQQLSNMKALPVGQTRANLDLLLSESLCPSGESETGYLGSAVLKLLSGSGQSRFFEFAVIAGHIAPRVPYETALDDATERDEQQAEYALRLIRLGRVGIEAALFGLLGEEIWGMSRKRRAKVLAREPRHCQKVIHLSFNLNADLQHLDFVRYVLYPACDDAYRRWRRSDMQTMLEIETHVDGMGAPDRHDEENNQQDGLEIRSEIWKERQADKVNQQIADEKRFFGKILSAYQEDPELAKLRFRGQWRWFKAKLDSFEE